MNNGTNNQIFMYTMFGNSFTCWLCHDMLYDNNVLRTGTNNCVWGRLMGVKDE